MALCIVGGSVVGYTLDTAIGDALTGLTTPSLLQNRTALLLSLIIAAASTWYFDVTERLRALYGDAARFRLTELADAEGGSLVDLLLLTAGPDQTSASRVALPRYRSGTAPSTRHRLP